MVWRVHREAAVLAGGQSALLMQIAHPLVAAGVAEHSDFPAGAWKRLRRTLDSTLAVVFGTTEEAERAAARVNALHASVHGTLRAPSAGMAAGTPYSALDPALLLWVHATLVRTSIRTYATLVGPLGAGERERYYEETKRAASAFGLDRVPATLEDFDGYVEGMIAGLEAGPDARRLAPSILRPAPRPVRAALWPAEAITAGLLPARVREIFAIGFGPARRAAFASAATVSRAIVPRLPASVRFVPRARAALRRVGPVP